MQLIRKLPPCFRRGPEMAEIQRVLGIAMERLWADVDDVWAQLDIETATWGLEELWEPMVGIKTDLSASLDARRSKVKAKLQGLGATTPAVIKAIAERFTGGVATVEEHPAEYWFRVIIDGLLNVPETMASLEDSVAEIKPAHIDQEYALRYQSGELDAYVGLVHRIRDRLYFEMEEMSA